MVGGSVSNRMASLEHRLSLPVSDAEPTPALVSLPRAAAPAPGFGNLVRDHSAYVLGLLRRLGVAHADLEDVAQEVFLAIHAQLHAFEARSSLKTWLCSVCRNKAYDHIRRVSRRRRLLAASPYVPETPSRSPQDELLHKESETFLQRELEKLPHEQREVFVLFEIEELSMKEVADAVSCPLDTAYTRHRVARQRIQAAFQRAALKRGGE